MKSEKVKLKRIKHASRILIAIFHFSLLTFILLPQRAEAGTIINRPLYLGLTQGLVGYWSFDGPDMSGNTAYDRSPGNANNGTLGGSTGQSAAPIRSLGKLGQALTFDGSNDIIVVTDSTTLEPVFPFSISLWFKHTSKCTPDSFVMLEKDTNNGYSIQCESVSGVPVVIMNGGGFGAGNRVTSSKKINDGKWHHAVFVVTGASAGQGKVYIDGVDDTGENDYGTPVYGAENLDIGSRNLTFPYPGSLDEIRIYNRTLNPDEARRLYQMGR